MVYHDRVNDLITNAFLKTIATISDEVKNVEEPNLDAKIFL